MTVPERRMHLPWWQRPLIWAAMPLFMLVVWLLLRESPHQALKHVRVAIKALQAELKADVANHGEDMR